MNKRVLFTIIGILLLIFLLSIGALFLIPTLTSASQKTAATPAPTIAVTANKTVNPTTLALRTNRSDIINQIAQGLKLSPTQLTTDLQGGQTLTQIASTQGVSSTQLQTIVSTAIQTSLQASVTSGELTQKQVQAIIKRFEKQPTQLDRFLAGRAIKKGTPTPTVSATPAQ